MGVVAAYGASAEDRDDHKPVARRMAAEAATAVPATAVEKRKPSAAHREMSRKPAAREPEVPAQAPSLWADEALSEPPARL